MRVPQEKVVDLGFYSQDIFLLNLNKIRPDSGICTLYINEI